MSKDNAFLLEPEKIELFRIRFANGKYSSGGCYAFSSKKGKVWPSRGRLHQHIAQLGYYVDRLNDNPWGKEWKVTPKNVPWFIEHYEGAVLVNETTGEICDALTYIDKYLTTKQADKIAKANRKR